MKTSDEEPGAIWEAQVQAIQHLSRGLPVEYCRRLGAIAALRAAFHKEMATALEPSLNSFAQHQPHDSIEDRNALASRINGDLRAIGLTLKCPRTQRPGLLVIDRKDAEHPDVSRFRVETLDDRGRRQRTFTSQSLPRFELMPDPVRSESLSKGFRRKGLSGPDLPGAPFR